MNPCVSQSLKRLALLFGLLFFCLLCASDAYAKEYSLFIRLTRNLETDAFSSQGVTLSEGAAPDRLFQPKDGYLLQLLTQKDEVIYQTRLLPEGPFLGDEKPPKEISFTLVVPYVSGTRAVLIRTPQGVEAVRVPVPSQDDLVSQYVASLESFKKMLSQEAKQKPPQQAAQKALAPPAPSPAVPAASLLALIVALVSVGGFVCWYLFIRKKKT